MKNYKWFVLHKGRKTIGVVYSISSWEAMKIAIEKYSKKYKKEELWLEKRFEN